MTYKFLHYYIPERMMYGIRSYIDERQKPGGFLQAVIQNNLKEAVGRADRENMANLPAFAGYFYNEAPIACWGSEEKYKKWLEGKEDK